MSDVGDERPARPQYGEYATPEEQRARIQQPDASAALSAGHAPDPVAAPTPQPQPRPTTLWGATPPVGSPAPVRANPADRIVTIALLAFGAFNVVSSVFSFFNLSEVAQQAMRIIGIDGDFTNVAAARVWGPIAAGVLVIGYLVTVLLSLRRIRAGRITWWLPLVGAVITYVVVYLCLAVPLLGDPAFTEYVSRR
jgi:hypothetical protein